MHGANENLYLLNSNTIVYIRKGEDVWDKGLGFGDEPINMRDQQPASVSSPTVSLT